MDFTPLISDTQLEHLKDKSYHSFQVIFKHSPRCVISNVSLNRLKNATIKATADFYLLNVLTERNLSNTIAEEFQVHHESPQILLIKNGECIYTESHNAITMEDIIEAQRQ